MKALIIYSTKGGVSKKCVELLTDRLSSAIDVTVCNVKSDQPPAPKGFDIAVIGGSIRMGLLNKRIKKYLKENTNALNSIKTALFLCCGFSESFDDYVSVNISKALKPSLGMHYFGGELKPEKLRGIDKFIVKRVRASVKYEDFESPDPNRSPLPEIIPENIYRLADAINSLL